MPQALSDLVDAFLAEEYEENPTLASRLGVDGYDDRLGEFTAADFERRADNDASWLKRFRSVDDEGFTIADTIDRDLAISVLRGRETLRDWQSWRRDPATYLGPCLNGVFTLFLHRLHDEADLVRYAAARLRAVPGVVAAARDNLDPELASPLIVDRAKGQCRAGITYARALVPAEVADPTLRAELAKAGEIAAGALEGFLVHLDELQATARGEWALGEERYSALLQEKEMLGYGAAEMRERGRRAYDEVDAEMSELARRVGGTDDWRTVLERLNADHPPSPEAMRAEYAEWTERARRLLHETGIVTMPDGEACAVEPSPPFQRPVLAVASYSAPPAFKPSLQGTFFVPFPPDGTPADEVQKRLATNSRASIPTISAHEAYPGHHWHFITAYQNPRPIRRVLGTPYFTEGWGLYAERLMREHGFYATPEAELAHLDARIFRAARIIVDTSLHMGEMSFEDAVTFMSTKASLSEPTARAEVGRYCAWPTQAAAYLTGCLEIERMRREWTGTLRDFNDRIAGSGMLPIGLAQRSLMEARADQG